MNIKYNIPIPVFPLHCCAVLPHTTASLHIFEPRYRQMTRDALDSNGLVAMATFQDDSWKKNYEGNPPVRPCVCVGYIARHKRHSDGRYHLLLQGLNRARVVQEIKSTPYRRAYLTPTDTQPTMEIDLDPYRDKIEQLLADPMLKQWAQVGAVCNMISQEIPTYALLDMAMMALSRCTEERYAMLAEPCPCKRAEWLNKMLIRTRQTLRRAHRRGVAISDCGSALN